MRAVWMIVSGLTLIGAVVGGAGVSRAAERRSKLPTSNYRGEWRALIGASLPVSIVFLRKTIEVTIDGEEFAMTGGRLSLNSFEHLFQFRSVEMNGNYGGESYTELSLIAGVLDSRDVLSGFYAEVDNDSEGEIKRGFTAPVALYRVSEESPRKKSPDPK